MDDAEDDGDMTRALGMDDAGSDGMVLSLLQVPMGKEGLPEPVRADKGAPGGERERLDPREVPDQAARLNQFDCEAYPKMCRAPFNCHRVPGLSADPSWLHGNASEGLAASGPNLQAWCSVPMFEGYIHTCLVEKDLAKAARLQYEGTKAGKYGPYSYELDGSYCFIEGHCLNTRVSHGTTLEEASQMCDERYGRSRWANFGSWLSHDVIGLPEPKNASNGFDGQENTAPFLLAGCAMGNYHCDVMYCRETSFGSSSSRDSMRCSIAALASHTDDEGAVFYYNKDSGKSTWDHPMDIFYRTLVSGLKRGDRTWIDSKASKKDKDSKHNSPDKGAKGRGGSVAHSQHSSPKDAHGAGAGRGRGGRSRTTRTSCSCCAPSAPRFRPRSPRSRATSTRARRTTTPTASWSASTRA